MMLINWIILLGVIGEEKSPSSSVTSIGITLVYNVSMEKHGIS